MTVSQELNLDVDGTSNSAGCLTNREYLDVLLAEIGQAAVIGLVAPANPTEANSKKFKEMVAQTPLQEQYELLTLIC